MLPSVETTRITLPELFTPEGSLVLCFEVVPKVIATVFSLALM